MSFFSSLFRNSSNQSSKKSIDSTRFKVVPPWNKIGLGQHFDLTLYHGTDIVSALQILKHKTLKPSVEGNLGPGIYFTDDKDTAQAIGKSRAKKRNVPGSAVIICRVKCYEKYCRKGIHGKWKGVCDEFIEYSLQEGRGSLQIQSVQFDEEAKEVIKLALLKKALVQGLALKMALDMSLKLMLVKTFLEALNDKQQE